jgi:hypothetical protein
LNAAHDRLNESAHQIHTECDAATTLRVINHAQTSARNVMRADCRGRIERGAQRIERCALISTAHMLSAGFDCMILLLARPGIEIASAQPATRKRMHSSGLPQRQQP